MRGLRVNQARETERPKRGKMERKKEPTKGRAWKMQRVPSGSLPRGADSSPPPRCCWDQPEFPFLPKLPNGALRRCVPSTG